MIESFEVAGSGDFVLVPVTVGHKRYSFVLDTGCALCAFDESLRSALEETDESVTVSVGGRYPIVRCRQASLGTAGVAVDGPAIRADLAALRENSGLDIYGILGMNFLERYVVRLDFDKRRATFLRSSERSPGVRIPIEFYANGVPMIEAALPGSPSALFQVDTGMCGPHDGALAYDEFRRLAKADDLALAPGKLSVLTLAGTAATRFGSLSGLGAAGFRHKQTTFYESGANVLGLGYLSRYCVTFDFPQRVIFLAKGEQFGRTTGAQPPFGGAIIVREGRRIIARVEAESTADRSGLLAGDELISVNGRNAAALSLYDLRQLLDGQPRTLRVRRADPAGSGEHELRLIQD